MPQIKDIIFLTLMVLAILFFSFYSQTLMGLSVQKWFMHRALIDTGMGFEYEFITANFAHYDWQHAIENIIALILIWVFFFNDGMNSFTHKIPLLFASMIGTTFGVYLFDKVGTYGGLSGALHGVAAGAAFLRLMTQKDFKGLVVLVIIGIKIAIDTYYPDMGVDAIVKDFFESRVHPNSYVPIEKNYNVSYISHTAGTISGLIMGFILYISFLLKKKHYYV